jgi:hypothetical protein
MSKQWPCPECGSVDTYRLNGPIYLKCEIMQQRHQCRDCGAKWLVWWSGEMLRTYAGPGEELERPAYKRRKDTGQAMLPGLGG